MKWLFAILIFGAIILFHEFGHFIIAKMNGVAVEEFSMGFGPRLVSAERGGTRYSLKLLPFGGSCQMKGMLEGGMDEDGNFSSSDRPDEDSFQAKSVGRRIAIVAAGPVFNFILAFTAAVIMISVMGYDPSDVTYVQPDSTAEAAGLLAGDRVERINGRKVVIGRDVDAYFLYHPLTETDTLTLLIDRDGEKRKIAFPVNVTERYLMGIRYYADDNPAVLTEVGETTPAYAAGIRTGDTVVAVNGTAVSSGAAFQEYFTGHEMDGSPVTLRLSRDGTEWEVSVVPTIQKSVSEGFLCYAAREKVSAPRTLRYSLTEIRFWIETVLQSLKMMFTGRIGVDELSGPVGVVNIVSETYEESKEEGALVVSMNMLYLLILLSANVGVMNLLPIPALDGGRLLFLIIEGLTGRKVNRKVEAGITFAGVLLLILLMVFVMYHDIARLF